MLSTAVISLMYCSIQMRKRGLTADRENNMWRYLDGVSAPPAKKKKSEAGEKQAKYEKEERRRAFLPSWQKKQALAEICACIAISVCHIANCFGWRQYVLRNLPVGFPVRRIIGPEKCFCRCRLHIASPGVLKIHETSSNHLKAITIVAAKSEPVKKSLFLPIILHF